MNRSWPAAAIGATGVVVAVVVGMASPASAGAGPTITVNSPAAGAVLTGDPTIAGNATMPGSLDQMHNISVSLTSSVTSDLPAPCDPCGSGHGQGAEFSWSPSLPYNGPYQAHVTATGSQFLFGALTGDGSSDASVSFRMEVPPGEPAGVRAEINADKTIRVSWSRNSEPDMIGYRVQRKDPGASTFRDVGAAVAQPSSGSTVSIVDPGATQAGTFVYQVQAIRAGRSGDASTAVGSGFSSAQVLVTAPAAAAAGTPNAPPGATPVATPAEGAAPTPDLSAFLKNSGGALPKASVPSAPQLPDGTFQENLPFGLPSGSEGGRGGNEAIGLHASSAGDGARAVMIPVASGLLLCLVAFHVRRLNGWLAAAPGGRSHRRHAVSTDLATEATVVATVVDRQPGYSTGVRILGDAPSEGPSDPLNGEYGRSGTDDFARLLSASNGANGSGDPVRASTGPSDPLNGPGEPSGSVSPKPAPVSFETWLKGPAGAAAGGDGASASDGDDDAKWAPPPADAGPATEPSDEENGQGEETPPNPRAWDDILVTPGAGTTRRSW